MAADRDRHRAGRPLRAGALLGCAVTLLAGCASMPDHGEVHGVEPSQRPDGQVRVFAMPPPQGAGPGEIVQGFLEALTSDDPDFEMARKYLAADVSKDWHPESSLTVLADGPSTSGERGNDGDRGESYSLSGTAVARVDGQRAYTPHNETYRESVHLTQEPGTDGTMQWRIDRPPSGVVLGESDFQRIYRSVSKYYYGADKAPGVGRQSSVVADPVYVRERIDPITQALRALLDGPTQWLAPAVRSSFPRGTQLAAGTKGLAPDDQNRLKVPLNKQGEQAGQKQCLSMAAQVMFTLGDLAPAGIEEVQLLRSDRSPLCVVNKESAEAAAPQRIDAQQSQYQYFLDADQKLVRTFGNSTGRSARDPVPGALGAGERKLRTVAVSRGEDRAAGVSLDGRSLFVGSLVQGAELGDAVLTSHAKSEDDRLTAPSWDGRGDLWVADRDPRKPRLYLLKDGAGKPQEVTVAGLGKGRLDAVRVAADGVRIALLVEQDGKQTLQIGRIQRTTEHGKDSAAVLQLRAAAPQMEEVTAMSWAGDSRLVIVGREKGGVRQIRYVQCDGSASEGAILPGLTGVQEIAASGNERLPLIAHSDDGIVRLPPGAPWQTVIDKGTAPVYPG